MMPRLTVCALALVLASLTPAAAQNFTGKPRAIDGDSIMLGGQALHLYGLDAPEEQQFCTRADGSPWRCGQEATFALARLLENHWAECRTRALDGDGTPLVVCRIGGPKGFEVNGQLVIEGWALAERTYANDYSPLEKTAKAALRNIWQGPFEDPAKWREKNQ